MKELLTRFMCGIAGFGQGTILPLPCRRISKLRMDGNAINKKAELDII
jgi:hypothetical protein